MALDCFSSGGVKPLKLLPLVLSGVFWCLDLSGCLVGPVWWVGCGWGLGIFATCRAWVWAPPDGNAISCSLSVLPELNSLLIAPFVNILESWLLFFGADPRNRRPAWVFTVVVRLPWVYGSADDDEDLVAAFWRLLCFPFLLGAPLGSPFYEQIHGNRVIINIIHWYIGLHNNGIWDTKNTSGIWLNENSSFWNRAINRKNSIFTKFVQE